MGAEFATERLRFFADLAAATHGGVDAVLFGASLCYFGDYEKWLSRAADSGSPFMIVDRTGFIDGPDHEVTVQRVRLYDRETGYPCWRFSRERFESEIVARLADRRVMGMRTAARSGIRAPRVPARAGERHEPVPGSVRAAEPRRRRSTTARSSTATSFPRGWRCTSRSCVTTLRAFCGCYAWTTRPTTTLERLVVAGRADRRSAASVESDDVLGAQGFPQPRRVLLDADLGVHRCICSSSIGEIGRVTYLDADCYFFSSPRRILAELDAAGKDVLDHAARVHARVRSLGGIGRVLRPVRDVSAEARRRSHPSPLARTVRRMVLRAL